MTMSVNSFSIRNILVTKLLKVFNKSSQLRIQKIGKWIAESWNEFVRNLTYIMCFTRKLGWKLILDKFYFPFLVILITYYSFSPI